MVAQVGIVVAQVAAQSVMSVVIRLARRLHLRLHQTVVAVALIARRIVILIVHQIELLIAHRIAVAQVVALIAMTVVTIAHRRLRRHHRVVMTVTLVAQAIIAPVTDQVARVSAVALTTVARIFAATNAAFVITVHVVTIFGAVAVTRAIATNSIACA